jgi:hypothetical protein
MKKRGYWGIAFYEPKFEENIGTAVRSANCFGANFITIIGNRYEKQPSDTMASYRHLPIFEPGRVRHAHVPRAQMSQFPVCPVSRRTAWRRPRPWVARGISSGFSSQVISRSSSASGPTSISRKLLEIVHGNTFNESVLAAVTRLDRRYDAAATVKSGHLTFTRRGRIQRPPSDYARPAPTRPAPTRAKHFSSGGEGGQGQRAPDGGPSISSCCGNRGQRTEAQRRSPPGPLPRVPAGSPVRRGGR